MLGVWALVAAIAGLGVVRLEIDSTTSSFLDRAHPAWRIYQRSLDLYGGDEFIAVALEAERPLDPATLRSVAELSERFEALPGVRRVDSLHTVPIVDATAGGSLSLEPALAGGVPDTPEGLARLGQRIRRDRLAPRSLISADERVFAINVLLDEDVDRYRDTVVAQIERLLAGRAAWVSGVPVFRTQVNTRTATELLIFVPLTLLLVGLLVAIAFGHLTGVLASLGAAALGTWLALGTMGATETPLSLSTVTLPSILLAMGCAYVMHVLTAARSLREPAEIAAAIARVARPIAISGLTTVIGFLAMSSVRIGAIRELATIGAIGVLAVLAAALTFAPAVLSLRPLGDHGGRLDGWIRGALTRRLVSLAVGWPRAIVACWLVLGAVFAVGATNLRVETDIILWFPTGTPIRDSYEAIRARLSGITPMNVLIESEDGRAVTEPEVLGAVDALAQYLEGLPEIGRALSVADPLRQIHGGFAGLPDAGLPDNRPLTEQYLLLLSSLPQLRDVIRDDRLGANVLLRVDVNGSRRLLSVADEVERWWRENGAAGFTARTTGIMYEFGRAEEEIAQGQLRGLGLAFAAIAVIFLVLFRRPGLAVAPFLPNALPLLMTYGFMGLVGIPLDAATVCIGSVALGIAVDDTVHVAVSYRAARDSGVHPQAALHLALHRVLPALILTTIAIGIGFAVLGLSEFTLVRHFGLETAGMVVLCLLADVTLLPVLLLAVEARRRESAPPS